MAILENSEPNPYQPERGVQTDQTVSPTKGESNSKGEIYVLISRILIVEFGICLGFYLRSTLNSAIAIPMNQSAMAGVVLTLLARPCAAGLLLLIYDAVFCKNLKYGCLTGVTAVGVSWAFACTLVKL